MAGKRKRNPKHNSSAPDKQPKPGPNAPSQKTPTFKHATSFLSLPREICQQIFYQSGDIGLRVEDLDISPRYRRSVARHSQETHLAKFNKMDNRATELGSMESSGVVEEDMEYVITMWNEDLQRLFKESENGRRYLLQRQIP